MKIESVEEQLDKLIREQLEVKPRSITVKIERAVRVHPTYWECRLRLTAEGWDTYDKVLYSVDNKVGYVIFCCIKEMTTEKRVSKEIRHQVYYFVMKFNFSVSRLPIMSLSFDAPYLSSKTPRLKMNPKIELEKYHAAETKGEPPSEGMQL